MDIEKYYKQIYKLSYITRYSNLIRVKDEDVAQHSFFVAAIILKLCDLYTFDLGTALLAAISHDILESDLSDVTYDIRQKYPRLDREIDVAEKYEIIKYPEAVQRGFKIFSGKSVEGLIANLADVIQVKQYTLCEISLGNKTPEIGNVKGSAESRIYQLTKELEPYERK